MAGETYAQEGQKVRMKDGTMAIVQGGQLVALPGGGGAKGGKMSPQAQAFLNDLSTKAASAREVGKLYDNVEGSMKVVRPGPYRNRLLLSPAIPEDNGGVLDQLGGALIGGVTRLTGAVKPEEVSAYQTMRAVQNAAVLERQLPQKGPQTESDAARMMLADISPGKDVAANKRVIDTGRKKLAREQARAVFYSKWATKYGHNQPNPEGMTADEVWAKAADHITNRVFPPKGGSTIRVVSRRKIK